MSLREILRLREREGERVRERDRRREWQDQRNIPKGRRGLKV